MKKYVVCAGLMLAMVTVSAPPATAGGLKVKAPGKFQQKVIVATAVGAAQGGYEGAAAGAAGAIVQNHAKKKWTGHGMQNWRRPSHW